METAYPRPSPVQLQNVLLVCRSLCSFFHLKIQVSTKFDKLKVTYMNHVLQVVHVLVIGSDVEDGGDRVSELDRELLDSGSKSYWGVHASSITGVVVPIHLIQADKESSTVVVHHVHADVDVSFGAVVHPAHR